MIMITFKSAGQGTMPEELNKGRLNDQMKYIEDRTRIYENFRAIREDMFQKIMQNIADTLTAANNMIAGLNNTRSGLDKTLDSLNSNLATTKSELEEITRTKNRIRMFGIEVNKITYNSIISVIILSLLAVLAIGFLAFKRNHLLTQNTKKELQDLKNEFEAYRKSSREAREKMSMDHFNEIKKLKGN